MSLKYGLLYFIMALFIAACAGPATTLPAVTPDVTTVIPLASTPTPNLPKIYPVLITPAPLPTLGIYPAPASPTTAIPALSPNEFAPQAGDEKLTRDTAFVEVGSSSLAFGGSFPVQVNVILTGNLPDGCHSLRILPETRENNEININVYSVVDPNMMCTAVIVPFNVTYPLGEYSSGQYHVSVNDEGLDEFGVGYQPQAGDEKMDRDQVLVDMENSRLLSAGTSPLQVNAVLMGTLPDPCHQLRVIVSSPNENKVINLEAYSLSTGERACIMVIQPYQAVIPLGSFTKGHYTVYVNGQFLGEFEAK